MSGNLSEFLKVLTIVVTWSTCILLMRRHMLSYDDSQETDTSDDSQESETIA